MTKLEIDLISVPGSTKNSYEINKRSRESKEVHITSHGAEKIGRIINKIFKTLNGRRGSEDDLPFNKPRRGNSFFAVIVQTIAI